MVSTRILFISGVSQCLGFRGCCNNGRYRQRLRLRHKKDLESAEGSGMRLILD